MTRVNRSIILNFSSVYNVIRNNFLRSNMETTCGSFSLSTFPDDIVTYEDVKKAGLENRQVMIVDVREPDELKESGVLPGSINIPLGTLESVLKDVPSEQFLATYGREKPSHAFPIIFSCRSGKRSAAAQSIAQQLGFKRVLNYSGGWMDWEEKSKCN